MRRKRKLLSWKGIFVRKIQNLFCRRMQFPQGRTVTMIIITSVLSSLICSAFCQVVDLEETGQSVRDRLMGVSVLEGYGRSHHQGFLNVRKVQEKVTLPVPSPPPPPPTSVPVLRRWGNLAKQERNESGAHGVSWFGSSSSGGGGDVDPGHFHAQTGNGSSEGGGGIPRKIEAIIPVHSKTHYLATLLARSLAPFFSMTTLWKEKCWSTKYEQGTCLSKKECQSRGGSAGGLCAGGFGVCCVFAYSCDSTTGLNRTYFVNPEFPFSISKSGASCHHEIRNLEGICQIRLDFEEFRLEPPGPDGTCWQDSFSVYGVDARLPPLCGDLSGQHAFLPVAFVHSINYVMVLTGEVPWRRWKIRTVKLPCNSPSLAPGGCLQNFHGESGRFTSFNYRGPSVHSSIDGLNYGVCVRRERGMCAIKWSQCEMNQQAEHYDYDYDHHHDAFRRKRSVTAGTGNATSPSRSMSTRSRSIGASSHYWSQTHSGEVQDETNFPVSHYPSGLNMRNSLIPKLLHSASSKWKPLVMRSPKPEVEVGRNTKQSVDVNNLVAKIPGAKAVVDKLKEITKKERNKEKFPIGASSTKYKITKPIKLKVPGSSLSKNKWKVPSPLKIKMKSKIKQKGDNGNSNFKSKIKKWISSLKAKKAAKAKAKKNKKKKWKYKSKGKKGKKRRKNKKRRKGLCALPFPFPFPVALPFPILGALGAGAGAGAGGGGGGGGGGGLFGGSGWHSEDGSVTTSVEPYLVRVVTNQEQPEGLRPVCIDYYQIPCESFDGGGGGGGWSV